MISVSHVDKLPFASSQLLRVTKTTATHNTYCVAIPQLSLTQVIGPGHAESLLSSIIDGMDMAKFKTPRCKAAFSSKEFDGAWRPPLHVSGMLVDGVTELF